MRGVRHFHTKVVGVTKNNRDGSNRQEIIRRCRVGEQLLLCLENDNPHDPNAIAVCRENEEQLGYLRAELAGELRRKEKSGYRFVSAISSLTGGGNHSRGVNLWIFQADPGISDDEVQNYVNENEEIQRVLYENQFSDQVDVVSSSESQQLQGRRNTNKSYCYYCEIELPRGQGYVRDVPSSKGKSMRRTVCSNCYSTPDQEWQVLRKSQEKEEYLTNLALYVGIPLFILFLIVMGLISGE